jgi:hypothetical protein
MASLVNYAGITGQTYPYEICDVNRPWKHVPANYCIAKIQGLIYFVPLYFGETEDIAQRMAGHNKLSLAAAYGATHILAHTNYLGEAARKAEERDLIRAYNPPCNVQHRSIGPGLLGAHYPTEFPLAAALHRGKK